jgi:DNA-3-methyladenine glycosylase II
MHREFTIVPEGPFSLRESAEFGFGQRAGQGFTGEMRLAFCLDGYAHQVGVSLTQDDGGVHGTVQGEGDLDHIQGQVARVLSLDISAAGFVDVGRRDPVIGRLQQAAPGLRPPLFYSPYEAAAWCVLSARRPARQMAEVRDRISTEHGAVFEFSGGGRLAAWPTPEQLLRVQEFAGLPPAKIERLHGVAQAALSGLLDVDRLKSSSPDQAIADLQSIKGIGPFYSSLIVLRGTGFADVLPAKPLAMDNVRRLYGLAADPTPSVLQELAEPWRPYRTWCIVLIRAAADRLPPTQETT